MIYIIIIHVLELLGNQKFQKFQKKFQKFQKNVSKMFQKCFNLKK
jgi:hypothetical protein